MTLSAVPPWFTALTLYSCQDTDISPATNVCLYVAEYSVFYNTFDCALSGPFDDLFLTCFSAPQTLCKGIIAVISASTV